MSTSRTRSWRRGQSERIECARQHYWTFYYHDPDKTSFFHQRRTGMLKKTPKLHSCLWDTRQARGWDKNTLVRAQAAIDGEEEIEHTIKGLRRYRRT